MQLLEHHSVRYWSKEINGHGVRVRAAIASHISITRCPRSKSEGSCCNRSAPREPPSLRDRACTARAVGATTGAALQAAAATRRRRDAVAAAAAARQLADRGAEPQLGARHRVQRAEPAAAPLGPGPRDGDDESPAAVTVCVLSVVNMTYFRRFFFFVGSAPGTGASTSPSSSSCSGWAEKYASASAKGDAPLRFFFS